jgi:leader peptidase (prepilin peptidase)/N-methyltransferase
LPVNPGEGVNNKQRPILLVGVLYVVLWASVVTVVWYVVWRRFKGLDSQAEWPFGPAIVVAALLWGL